MRQIKRRKDKKSLLIKPISYDSFFSGEEFTEKPCFCFQYLHPKFTSKNCSDEQKSGLLLTFEKLSGLRWIEIEASPRHGLGTEKIVRTSIKPDIPKIVPRDATFIAIRFAGLAPIIGFREKNIYHIVFIDAHFNVYDHE
jgi:hypothetical protein